MTGAIYDSIGSGYGTIRREDPGIAAAILDAIGCPATVVNVGAGAGSYEPREPYVVAVEPSRVMIAQRRDRSEAVVQGIAEALPFADDAFEVSLAVLTIHHWSDLEAGLSELRRVARDRVVILTHDPGAKAFWLNDYFPEIEEIDSARLPSLARLVELLGSPRVVEVPIAHDCTDGFLGAYWRRPARYLDPRVRSAISCFARMRHEADGVAALARDIDSGEWTQRYGDLAEREELDLGYRILVAESWP